MIFFVYFVPGAILTTLHILFYLIIGRKKEIEREREREREREKTNYERNAIIINSRELLQIPKLLKQIQIMVTQPKKEFKNTSIS